MMLSHEDHLAIQQLYARYNHAFDLGDPERWAACFTPDGSLGADHIGREQIAALARRIGETRRKGRRWISSLVLDSVAEGSATGTCYLMFVRVGVDTEPPRFVSTAVYEDELNKCSDGWKFKSR